jgi:hypothetical protein
MATVFINPGTEASDTATEDNALKIAERICADTGSTASRHPEADNRGWFGFRFVRDGRTAEVDIPGDDPDVVCEGRPWVSRRLYVEGSSWLYGYAMNAIERQFNPE